MDNSKFRIQHSTLPKSKKILVSGLIDDFGYKPDTSLEVGIGRFVKWYKEFYGENK